jgi:hypothetical protein
MGELTLTGDKLVVAIRREHEAASAAARSALEHALECGRLLAQARADIPHGGWENYLRDVCGIAPRTGRLYLRLHEHRGRLEDRQRVAGLTVREAARLVGEPRPEVAKVDRPREAAMLDEAQVIIRLHELQNLITVFRLGWEAGESAAWQTERLDNFVRLSEELQSGIRSSGRRAWAVDTAADAVGDLRDIVVNGNEEQEHAPPRWYAEGQMHEGLHSAGWLVEVWPHPGGSEWVHFVVAVPGVDGPSHLEGPKRGCRVDRLTRVMSRVYSLPDVDGPGWDWNVRPVREDDAELVEAHYNSRLYTCAGEYAELELR